MNNYKPRITKKNGRFYASIVNVKTYGDEYLIKEFGYHYKTLKNAEKRTFDYISKIGG